MKDRNEFIFLLCNIFGEMMSFEFHVLKMNMCEECLLFLFCDQVNVVWKIEINPYFILKKLIVYVKAIQVRILIYELCLIK